MKLKDGNIRVSDPSYSAETVIGQTNFNEVIQHRLRMNKGSGGIDNYGTKWVVGDSFRVLIFNQFPTSKDSLPDLVLGQQSLDDFPAAAVTVNNRSVNSPTGISVCADGKLVIADNVYHRVLIWNTFPTQNNQPADLVLGQPDFSTTGVNTGLNKKTWMNAPLGVDCSGGKLIITERFNHRVKVWNSFPTTMNQEPDLFLGQADENGVTANRGIAVGGGGFNLPLGVATDGTRLLITDTGNHRVHVWSTFPVGNGEHADFFLGQTLDSTNGANNGGVNDNSIAGPVGVSLSGGKVVVTDQANHRVLVWNTFPVAPKEAATYVLNKTLFTDATANPQGAPTASSHRFPWYIGFDGTKLIIGDGNNSRLQVWNSISGTGDTSDFRWGQPDSTTASTKYLYTARNRFTAPQKISYDGQKVIVTDSANNRVLIWNTPPESWADLPDLVIGQPNFDSFQANAGGAISEYGLSNPQHAFSDGNRLIVADTLNNRVLIWDPFPTTSYAPATQVLGQALFTTNTKNTTVNVNASTIGDPSSVYSNGTYLLVADAFNHRVLMWSAFPIGNNAGANIIIGKPNSTSSNNTSAISNADLSDASSVFVKNGKLFVADKSRHRIMIWNSLPTGSGAFANQVIGQPDFSTNSLANPPTGNTLSSPNEAYVDDNGAFYVSDTGNHRVLIWNQLPSDNSTAPDYILGQSSTTAFLRNKGLSVNAEGLNSPTSVSNIDGKLFVTDRDNHRVLIFDK